MSSYDAVESLIQAGLQDTAPAMTLCVYYRGERIVHRAYGYYDPETKRHPITTESIFDLASVSKLFTTTAFLIQVAEGKTKLDDPVASILPEFAANGERKIAGGQNPHTLEREESTKNGTVDPAQVTFRHLLTHTSGLAPWRDLFIQLGDTPPPPDSGKSVDHTSRLQAAINHIAAFDYVDSIGASVNYSDLGLIALGTAVAKMDDTTLDNVIYRRLNIGVTYNPSRINACVPTEDDQRWRKRRCRGEVHDENACALGGIAGHAGLFGTAEQVAQLGNRWLYALDGNDPSLPQAVAQEAIKNHKEDRGLGWVLRSPELSSSGQHFSDDSFGHTGFTGTSLWVDPQRQLVVSLMTNRVYFGRDSLVILPFRRKIHDAIALWVDAL